LEWVRELREVVWDGLVWVETIAENHASECEQDHRRTENTDLYRICLRPMTIHFHAFLPFTQMASAWIISLRSSRSDHQVRSGERIERRLSQYYPTPLNLLAACLSLELAEKINNYLNI